MPEPQKKPSPDQQQGKPPVAKQPVAKQPPEPQKKKPEPKVKKDETLKYTMTYANGGFNNGVEIKPGKDGKIELNIAIYGGGEQKSLGISGLSPEIEKLIRAYEIGATSNEEAPELVDGLKGYFTKINQVLSMKIIQILQKTDNEIAAAIKQTFKEVK